MKIEDSDHLIFSDESGWEKDSRFGCLAKISGTYEHTKELNGHLQEILSSHKRNEMKFKSVKGHDAKKVAIEFYKKGFEFLNQSKIKIHILAWDKHDNRHDIKGRSDIENLKRMYFHNLKVMKNHWKVDTNWNFYPDEFTAIDWKNDVVKYLIDMTLIQKDNLQFDFFNEFKDIRIKYNNVKELQSDKYPIIQLADLFAGVVRASRLESERFMIWFNSKENENQLSFFELPEELIISKNLLPKYELMYAFKKLADANKMGISLKEEKYFKTFNCKKNIFIWHYSPQGEYDKAPVFPKKT
ncbi:MAG: DUF3800 domain-containing protein [Flavobacteriaceae bacterium]|jgi:hypothetical protein|nr:DUF3800 domain-containing protein [Flavobacteriaceae bacterium]